MVVLGVDYGLVHVGLAVADSRTGLVEPLVEIATEGAGLRIRKICEERRVGRVVVGLSEGKMATATAGFVDKLRSAVKVPVELADEALSSREAREKLSHRSWRARRRLEHAAAAAIILERWMESQNYV